MKKILSFLSAVLLFAACDDSKEEAPDLTSVSIVGNWLLTEEENGSYYVETLTFDEAGKFTHYGEKTWSHQGNYIYDARNGLLSLYYTSGEDETYLITLSSNRMILRYLDEIEGPESPVIFYRQ